MQPYIFALGQVNLQNAINDSMEASVSSINSKQSINSSINEQLNNQPNRLCIKSSYHQSDEELSDFSDSIAYKPIQSYANINQISKNDLLEHENFNRCWIDTVDQPLPSFGIDSDGWSIENQTDENDDISNNSIQRISKRSRLTHSTAILFHSVGNIVKRSLPRTNNSIMRGQPFDDNDSLSNQDYLIGLLIFLDIILLICSGCLLPQGRVDQLLGFSLVFMVMLLSFLIIITTNLQGWQQNESLNHHTVNFNESDSVIHNHQPIGYPESNFIPTQNEMNDKNQSGQNLTNLDSIDELNITTQQNMIDSSFSKDSEEKLEMLSSCSENSFQQKNSQINPHKGISLSQPYLLNGIEPHMNHATHAKSNACINTWGLFSERYKMVYGKRALEGLNFSMPKTKHISIMEGLQSDLIKSTNPIAVLKALDNAEDKLKEASIINMGRAAKYVRELRRRAINRFGLKTYQEYLEMKNSLESFDQKEYDTAPDMIPITHSTCYANAYRYEKN